MNAILEMRYNIRFVEDQDSWFICSEEMFLDGSQYIHGFLGCCFTLRCCLHMSSFQNVLDHFSVCGTLFEKAVQSVNISHTVDNLSDHDPPKGRKGVSSDSSEYRGIALSSIFGKVLDLIILNRYADFFITSDLQFGFKAKRSTNMCTMVLKEAIDYYTSNGRSVFCTLLDATKALDRVDYCKLFRSLMYRDLPPIVLHLLLNMYTRQVTRVSWNGVFSSPFTVSNGVKEGGILSPILFCIYTVNHKKT